MSSADVVIAGYGPAGASAAIAAHDAGAHVIVVDSAARGGGNARYSGGFLFDIPPASAVEQLDALCFGRTDPRVLEVYASGLHQLSGWLGSLGGTTAPFTPPPGRFPAPFPSWPSFPAGQDVRYGLVQGAGRPGEALWDVLDAAVRQRGIEVRFGVQAQRLDLDAAGSVTGLCVTGLGVTQAGREAILPARGGVVLATGGFEGSPALTDAYLPLGPVRPVGHPGNRGAGLRMAQVAGAALWHMYGFFGWFAFAAPEFAAPFPVDVLAASYIVTDADGRRFADETGYEVHDRLRALLSYLPRHPNRPRLPSWVIFDEAARQAGPLCGRLGTPNDYAWSPDNTAEIDRGWIRCADSPGELAQRIGVEPEILAGTLSDYNAAAGAGRDERFGRSPDTLVPLDTRRLYAIETWPGLGGTTGGPRHDERARVLRPDGAAIPGLYAAGSVSAVWGHLTDHGGGLTDAMVFGRYAGAEAAARAHDAGAEAAARKHDAGAEAAGQNAVRRGSGGAETRRQGCGPAGTVRMTRVAVVTGGAGAIGGSIVTALGQSGHTVCILDQAGDQPVDLADEHQVRAAAARILAEAGRCDVLVHAAAAFDRADLAAVDLDRWRRVQAVNVESALLLAQAFVPGMAARRFGRIIFVVSDTIWSPPRGDMLPYVTSKGALVALARTLAVGHGGDGIAVTCVAPGLTATPAAQRGIPPAGFDEVRARQALPRTLVPGDVAATVCFLASDGAAALTGQTLCVDGGLVLR